MSRFSEELVSLLPTISELHIRDGDNKIDYIEEETKYDRDCAIDSILKLIPKAIQLSGGLRAVIAILWVP